MKNLTWYRIKPKSWYCEYEGHHRFHDYFSLMINNFPIFVIRRMDNPHSENDHMDKLILLGIIGYSFTLYNAFKK